MADPINYSYDGIVRWAKNLDGITNDIKAKQLATPKTISVQGCGMSGSTSFDGSANVSINLTGGSLIPIGCILPWMGIEHINTHPEGFLYCNGKAVLKSEYPELFAILGSRFNAYSTHVSDPSTQFALPDLRDLYLKGGLRNDEEGYIGVKLDESLPNITGSIDSSKDLSSVLQAFGETVNPVVKGAFSSSWTNRSQYGVGDGGGVSAGHLGSISFDASDSDSIYGNIVIGTRKKVIPASMNVNWIIKAK